MVLVQRMKMARLGDHILSKTAPQFHEIACTLGMTKWYQFRCLEKINLSGNHDDKVSQSALL